MKSRMHRRVAPPLHQDVDDGFALLDQELRFCEVNATLAAMNGVPVADHLGRTVAEVLPLLAPTVEPLLRQVLASGEPMIDIEVRGSLIEDGPPRRWLSSYYPVRSRGGSVVAIDVVVRALPALPWPESNPQSLEALREREHFAASITEASPCLIYVYDVVMRCNRYVNNRLQDHYGYSEADLEALGPDFLLQLLHPDDLPGVLANLERLLAARDGEVLEHTYRFRHKDGTWRWLRSHELVFRRDGAGAVTQVLGVAEDITARKGVEAQLHWQAGMLEHSRDAILIWEPDGGIVFWNRGAEQLYGYARDEALGKVSHELLRTEHPAERQAFLAALKRSGEWSGTLTHYARSGRALVVESHHVLVPGPDGQRWVLETNRDAGTRPDAAFEPSATHAAAEAELRFQAQLLDAVGQGVIATDIDGTVRYWNRSAEQLYGWRREEAIGRNILDLVAAELSLRQGQEIMARLQAGERWAGSYVVRRRDGTTFPAFVTDVPLTDVDGRVVGIVGVSADISHQHALEAERSALLAREREARARTDEALALLDTLFATAPIGLCFLDPGYRYLRINEALAGMNHLPLEQHLGRTVREVLPALAPMVEPLFDQVLRSGEPLLDQEVVEERAPEAGGRRIWRASYYPVRIPDGPVVGLGIVANDITFHRAAAEALRLSEERFRIALKNAPITVYTTDSELRYTWIYNPDPLYDQALVLGRRDEELLPAEDAARLTALKQRVLDRRRGECAEVALVLAGQRRLYNLTVEPMWDSRGALLGLTVAAVEITRLRTAEEALRESEARLRALAELVPAFLFTNQADGQSDYVSQSFYDFTGAPPGSTEGSGWAAYLHPDDQEHVAATWRAALAAASPASFEYRFRRHDGVYRWFRGHCVPAREEHGRVTRWFGAALDVEDLKQAEAEREALLARERAAVEARDSFISIASHDLRSPLTALLGRAELLVRQGARQGAPEPTLQAARVIADQAKRLNRMLGALFDISRIESGKLTLELAHLDLAALAARCVRDVAPTLTQHTLALHGLEAGLWVQGDEVRLEQVLLNLLSNATKYSPAGGTITVTVERDADEARVTVTDEGIGIPAAVLPRLFERFYRAPNASASGISGLGIGLYAVREILTLHGGQIVVSSTEGRGSTFRVTLPVVRALPQGTAGATGELG